jgi:hypothetical protein
MRLYRALLDRQAVGDLLVQQAFGQQAQYARLLLGEAGQAAGEIGIGWVDGQGGDGVGQSGGQPGAAVEYVADRLADLGGAGALWDEA